MASNKLTKAIVANAKYSEEKTQLFDGQGLFLHLMKLSDGRTGKYWRMLTTFRPHEGAPAEQIRLSFGVWPKVSLDEARKARDAALSDIEQYIDPRPKKRKRAEQQQSDTASTFEELANEWIEAGKQKNTWEKKTLKNHIDRLNQHLFPYLGELPFEEVTANQVEDCIKRLVNRGKYETAKRTLTLCHQVYQYAIAYDKTSNNPAARVRGRNPIPVTAPNHYAAITDQVGVSQLLRDIYAYEGQYTVQCAMRFAPLVFLRSTELRHAKWEDIDFSTNLWSFFPAKLKQEQKGKFNKLTVPLSKQALAILNELKPLTGKGIYVFEGREKNRPLSDNTFNQALRRSGIPKEKMVFHGFRAMARTMLVEELGYPPELVERQLSHVVRAELGRAYDRTIFLDNRREMMQRWANFLDDLRLVGEHKPDKFNPKEDKEKPHVWF